MKRDPDLVRKILPAYEALPYGGGEMVEIPGFTEEEVNYHQEILEEAGFIKAQILKDMGGGCTIFAERLTYSGHEFLDASRDNHRWEKAKKAMQATGGFALDVLQALLISYAKAEIGLQ